MWWLPAVGVVWDRCFCLLIAVCLVRCSWFSVCCCCCDVLVVFCVLLIVFSVCSCLPLFLCVVVVYGCRYLFVVGCRCALLVYVNVLDALLWLVVIVR